MAKLTLVPKALARGGRGFVFNGAGGSECEGCPYQRLCFNLQAGHRYEVERVRELTHPCALHDGGRVHVVEVREAPFATSLETRHLRGTAAHWSPVPCGMPECPSYALCHPVGPREGRHEIVEGQGTLECPAGFELAKVRLRPME